MKTNLKPLIDEGYRYFAIDDSEGGLNGAIMGKFKVYDDAKNFYETTLYCIYTADRLVGKHPDFFEIKEESKLDLTEILRDCPEGTKLYSPIGGDATFKGIVEEEAFPIVVQYNDGFMTAFTKEGKFYNTKDAECILFPSKDNRDWSTFKTKPEPEPEPEFKPFDRVLVRSGDDYCWEIDFFDHYNQDENFPYRCLSIGWCRHCIPYEGNEHLCGTSGNPKE